MVSSEDLELARRANEFYETHLKHLLDPKQRGAFVAIDPDSGTYYLGRTLDEAIDKARQARPEKLMHVKRVGFRAAVEVGNSHDHGPH